MGNPSHVEFFVEKDRLLIAPCAAGIGFKVRKYKDGENNVFCCRYITSLYSVLIDRRSVVYRDPLSVKIGDDTISPAFEIRLEKEPVKG